MPVLPAIPQVVASVNNPSDLADLAGIDINAVCDVLEFRLDGLDNDAATDAAISNTGIPLILTARRPDEGAFSPLPLDERLEKITRHASADSWIDLECRTLVDQSDPSLSAALATIRAAGAGLIASYHDFNSVPGLDTVDEWISIATEHQAVLKIACTVNSPRELAQWSQVLEKIASLDAPFSFMGMGKFGMATRIAAAAQGSLFNYGYLNKASVPGQWPASALKQAFTFLPE